MPLAAGGERRPAAAAFLQGAELIGSLTRLQHGDVAALPGGSAGASIWRRCTSGTTNVVRELKSSSLGNQVDQTDGVTIDIVAMLFDQIFGDKRVPEALKALIGRLQIPVVKVAVLDKKFFSKKSHPARRMLDTLGEFALGLDESFDQTRRSTRRSRASSRACSRTSSTTSTSSRRCTTSCSRWSAKRTSAPKTPPRKWRARSPTRSGWKSARRWRSSRSRTARSPRRMPQLVQKFLADEWVKLLLLTYARHGQDSDAWKSALETMDL